MTKDVFKSLQEHWKLEKYSYKVVLKKKNKKY